MLFWEVLKYFRFIVKLWQHRLDYRGLPESRLLMRNTEVQHDLDSLTQQSTHLSLTCITIHGHLPFPYNQVPAFTPHAESKYRYVGEKKICSNRNLIIYLIMFKMEGEILYLAVKIISPNLNNLRTIIVAVVIRQFETEMHCVCAVEKE